MTRFKTFLRKRDNFFKGVLAFPGLDIAKWSKAVDRNSNLLSAEHIESLALKIINFLCPMTLCIVYIYISFVHSNTILIINHGFAWTWNCLALPGEGCQRGYNISIFLMLLGDNGPSGNIQAEWSNYGRYSGFKVHEKRLTR